MAFLNFFEIISRGGWVMYPLLACSILSLTVIIYRLLWGPKAQQAAPNALRTRIISLLLDGQEQQALIVAEQSPSMAGRIFAELLAHSHESREELWQRAEIRGRALNVELDRFLAILSTVATVAPLLGLLGTVFGMIETFSVLHMEGIGNATALSGGISAALLTTAFGLVVAIPSTIFYRYFLARTEEISDTLEIWSAEVCHALSVRSSSDQKRSNDSAATIR
ncbi:MAG: MotA/TolQ/ExbB proton channel family protein [bacterium]|nr:MotA/TolQ/ExbB proton channel family protein [bacterium]